jgi:acylphosphatase
MRAAVRAEIRGRVQGVGYRAWTADRARALGLAGWVRNRSDGSVEALFAGPADAVEAMLAACLSGPAAARVEAVERRPADDPGGDGGFAQLPTA